MRDSVDTSFNPHDASMYGVDPAGPLPDEECTAVSAPKIIAPLEGDELREFLDSIDTNTTFSSYDMGLYQLREGCRACCDLSFQCLYFI